MVNLGIKRFSNFINDGGGYKINFKLDKFSMRVQNYFQTR